MSETARGRVGELTLMPYVVKTDLFGPETERYRFEAELGRLLVPENRQDSGSALIELAFIRMKSRASHPAPPLVLLAGGPGVAGSEWSRFGAFVPWFEELLGISDVILLDQRGTGLSNPRLDCLERWNLPLGQVGEREHYLREARSRCELAATFWRDRGVDLAGYTTLESADDIDALRQALGLDKICLYGASYGSHLALATVRRHGAHIARAIIALVEGPDQTIKLPDNIQHHLQALASLVEADQQLRPEIPDLLALMRTTLERLEHQPAEVLVVDKDTGEQVQVVAGKFDLQLITAHGLGDVKFLQQLPRRYATMARGDFSWLAEEVLKSRRSFLGNAMSYCMDSASGASPERMGRVARQAPHTLLEDVMDLPFPYIASIWDVPDLGPEFRSPIVTDVPVLFVSGSLDGRTPPSNVDELGNGFANSKHIVVRGGAHSSPKLVSIPAIRAVITRFLLGEAITDPQAEVPFAFTPL